MTPPAPDAVPSTEPEFLRITVGGEECRVTDAKAVDRKEDILLTGRVIRPGHEDEEIAITVPGATDHAGTFACDPQHTVAYTEHDARVRTLTTSSLLPATLVVSAIGKAGAYIDGSFNGKVSHTTVVGGSATQLKIVDLSVRFHVLRSST